MKTELQQNLQTEDALSNVQAATPYQLTDSNLTSTLPPAYLSDDTWEKAKPKGLVNPPSTKEINKQMWVGSFLGALMVGLTTKDAGAALTGGLLTAISLHDYGNALQKRGSHVADMQKRGYSAPAILAYYQDGNQELINQERDDMRAGRQLDHTISNSDRNFEEGKRRFDDSSAYRDASLAQRERFQNANLSFRRQTLDMRREQLNATMRKGQIAEGVANMQARDINQSILTTGIDPTTGKSATGAARKTAQDWQTGNDAYRGQRSGILNQIDKVNTLQGLDIANGTGMLEGRVSPSLFLSGEAQQVRNTLDNLKSGQFVTNIAALKGMGALSEAEGARIQNIVASLDPSMSADELKRQLADVENTLLTALEKADSNAAFYNWDEPTQAAQEAQVPGDTPPEAEPKLGKQTTSKGLTMEVTKE